MNNYAEVPKGVDLDNFSRLGCLEEDWGAYGHSACFALPGFTCYKMESYKNKLQECIQKLHLPLPVYESVNEGFDHLPNFKCSVTVNGVRYESTGAHKHKKEAEQSAAQAAIQDLATRHSDYQFEETIGKKLLMELLARMGRGSPTFSFAKMGAAHSPDFTSTLEIDGVSYVGGVAKSKKEAETKAAFVAFQAIKAQVGGPHSQLQLHTQSKGSHDLEQPTEECIDFKSEVKTITTSCTPNNTFVVGTNSQQDGNAYAVEKGFFGKSNAYDVNSACATVLHNQLEQETFIIPQEQEDIEAKKQGVHE
ncbi:hypothetical protein KI387_030349, partial [Taxus chinensis]